MSIRLYLNFIKKLLKIFGKSNRYLILLFISFVLLALLDMLGISLIGPFVVVFFDFEKVQNEWGLFIGMDQRTLTIYASITIVSIFLIRTLVVWALNSFILGAIFQRQTELRSMLVEELLLSDYSLRLQKSTGNYSTAITSFCSRFAQSAINFFRILAESLSIIVIIGLLMFTDIKLFLIALFFAGSVFILMFFFFSRRFVEYGEAKNEGLFKFTNAVQEAVYGIKEIKILGLTQFFRNRVHDGAARVAFAEKRLYLYSIVPKYIIETMLVMIICMMLVVSSFSNNDPLDTIAILSVFLVAALRLLPSVSLIISAINSINLDIDSVNKLYDEIFNSRPIERSLLNPKKLKSQIGEFEFLEIRNLEFSHKPSVNIFKDLTLRINKGDFIGLIGESGQGKTTLVDLLLGINKPAKGNILVDGKDINDDIDSWRSKVAYLPQETFLIAGNIYENIALGQDLKDINLDKVEESIEKAGLGNFIHELPDGLNTKISERGLNFSGGQRQRIALARAFYSDRQFFILDESTSALDKKASEKVIQQVSSFSKMGGTVIIISHNEKSLGLCSRKLRLVDGNIEELSS